MMAVIVTGCSDAVIDQEQESNRRGRGVHWPTSGSQQRRYRWGCDPSRRIRYDDAVMVGEKAQDGGQAVTDTITRMH